MLIDGTTRLEGNVQVIEVNQILCIEMLICQKKILNLTHLFPHLFHRHTTYGPRQVLTPKPDDVSRVIMVVGIQSRPALNRNQIIPLVSHLCTDSHKVYINKVMGGHRAWIYLNMHIWALITTQAV